MLLKTLVNRGGGVNSSSCRGMSVGTEANSFHRFFGGHVGMERPNVAFDEKYLRIRGFMERINIGLVILVMCDFNEVHGVTIDGENHNSGDYCWNPCSI